MSLIDEYSIIIKVHTVWFILLCNCISCLKISNIPWVSNVHKGSIFIIGNNIFQFVYVSTAVICKLYHDISISHITLK